jgi:hypothetical protein
MGPTVFFKCGTGNRCDVQRGFSRGQDCDTVQNKVGMGLKNGPIFDHVLTESIIFIRFPKLERWNRNAGLESRETYI